jgi:putative DNA primase/helicase
MATKRQQAARSVQTILASDVQPESVEYLLDDLLPECIGKGMLNLWAGRPKQGKSLMQTFVAAELTKRGQAVVLSNPEDGTASTQVPRLMAHGADLRFVHFWPGLLRWDDPQCIEDLRFLVEHQGVAAIMVDPIRKHVRGSDKGVALMPIISMAEETGVALIGNHHMLKKVQANAHPQEAIGGDAGGFLGSSRACWAFGPIAGRDSDVRIMAPVAVNNGEGEYAFEFMIDTYTYEDLNGEEKEIGRLVLLDVEADVQAGQVVGFNGGGSKGSIDMKTLSVAQDWLVFRLLHGPVRVKDLQDECVKIGVSWRSVERAKKELALISDRVGFGKGSHVTWRLPDDHPALAQAGLVPAPVTNTTDSDDEDGEPEDEFDAAVAALLADS